MPAVLRPSVESRSNLTERSFITYRDVEMLNFVLGRDLLFFPNKAQVLRGLDYAAQHSIWPAKDSVAVLNGQILVVVLEPPHDQVATTMDVP